jgi:prefoldin subunit 4
MMTSNQAEEVDVRFEDQEKINEFGRMNNRLLEIRADLTQFKQDIEKLDDAATELAMNATGKVMLFIGESFLHTSEDHATEYCEKKQEV